MVALGKMRIFFGTYFQEDFLSTFKFWIWSSNSHIFFIIYRDETTINISTIRYEEAEETSILNTILAHATQDYYVSTDKSAEPDQACVDLGGELVTITDENVDIVRGILPRGKFIVSGATKDGKCNFFSRVGKVLANKKCRKLQYICDLSAKNAEPVCEPDSSVVLDENYFTLISDPLDDAYSWHEARDFCSSLGDSWDLAIINTETELETISNYLDKNCYR